MKGEPLFAYMHMLNDVFRLIVSQKKIVPSIEFDRLDLAVAGLGRTRRSCETSLAL